MSTSPLLRDPGLRQLIEEGFQVSIRENHLLVEHVPYLTSNKDVRYGTLAAPLELAGDEIVQPNGDQRHVFWFAGDAPCDAEGNQLGFVNASPDKTLFPGFTVEYMLSHKPVGGYPTHYEKVRSYVAYLLGPAQMVHGAATPNTFASIPEVTDASPFRYRDTASARTGVTDLNAKMRGLRIAIVGLGGTGSYILDLVAKCDVEEIHLYDGDEFINHNAFRAPGAASLDEVSARSKKVDHFQGLYERMRRGIVAHGHALDGSNAVGELSEMDFVFVAADHTPEIVETLTELRSTGVPFIDCGVAVRRREDLLDGAVRTNMVTAATPESLLVTEAADATDEYATNIQTADLNALNAAFAVIRFKRHIGIYRGNALEHQSLYVIEGNQISNAIHDSDG